MKTTSTINWKGNLREGNGTLTTQSGTLNKTPYNFKVRFEENHKGTNPEELLASAHGGCFTMSVAAELTKKGFTATSLDTEATVTLKDLSITGIHVSITGAVPNISSEEFKSIVEEARQNCIISRALNVPITADAVLVV